MGGGVEGRSDNGAGVAASTGALSLAVVPPVPDAGGTYTDYLPRSSDRAFSRARHQREHDTRQQGRTRINGIGRGQRHQSPFSTAIPPIAGAVVLAATLEKITVLSVL